MKRNTLFLLMIILGFDLSAQNQPSIEALKKENNRLKEQISVLKQDTIYLRQVVNTCDLLKKSSDFNVTNSNSKLVFQVLSCTGSRSAQTVTIEFMVSHSLVNQVFSIHSGSGAPTAFDNLGNTFECKSIEFQNSRNGMGAVEIDAPTDIRIKGSITFRNILPSTELLTLARFDYYLYNKDGGYGKDTEKIAIKNIKIKW